MMILSTNRKAIGECKDDALFQAGELNESKPPFTSEKYEGFIPTLRSLASILGLITYSQIQEHLILVSCWTL